MLESSREDSNPGKVIPMSPKGHNKKQIRNNETDDILTLTIVLNVVNSCK